MAISASIDYQLVQELWHAILGARARLGDGPVDSPPDDRLEVAHDVNGPVAGRVRSHAARILFVEDNVDMATMYRFKLESDGFSV